ncbi:hypothetical protein [Paraconexibacter sp.]|uniref:hypothetical protein n=1 Tax=Paraconexibacter sp. TaxID=2949640 RepID=UPI0035630451
MTRRLPILALLATASLSLAACGGVKGEVEKGETEGIQVTVGDLQYQVQISRVLNPAEVEDKGLLRGVPIAEQTLPDGTEWFAVFVQARNNRDEPHLSASREDFAIEDTLGTEFETVEVDNPLAYEQETVPADGMLPEPDSIASSFNTNGSLLLFKITRAALENRPLVLIIKDPKNPSEMAEVDLDI